MVIPPVLPLRLAWPVMALLGSVLLGACGGSDADEMDMRVDDDAAMDTTPAGTPAPPSLPAVAGDLRRQTGVTLDEWNLVIENEAMPAGEITFRVTNTGTMPHALAVDGVGAAERTEVIESGGTRNLTVRLDPGTYRLFCPDTAASADHAERGMSAPLVVR